MGGNFVRMDSDERPVPKTDSGEGIGLRMNGKQWRDQRMSNREKPTVEERRPPDTSDAVELGDTSSGDGQRRPTRISIISQRSAQEPRNSRDKSSQSRVSFDSEPAQAHVPPSDTSKTPIRP